MTTDALERARAFRHGWRAARVGTWVRVAAGLVAAAFAIGAASAEATAAAAAPSKTMPKAALEWRIFRVKLTDARKVTSDEAAVISRIDATDTVGQRMGGLIVEQARHLRGGPWIAVPGRIGLVMLQIRPEQFFAFSILYREAHNSSIAGMVRVCGTTDGEDRCLEPGGGSIDYFQVAPDGVESAVFAGTRLRAVDGIFSRVNAPYTDSNPVFASFRTNEQAWRERAAARAKAEREAARKKAAKKKAQEKRKKRPPRAD